MKVVHMTSVHPWDDKRIFQKMCKSLASAGFDISVVYSSSEGDSEKFVDGVKVLGVACSARNRAQRVILSTWAVFNKTRKLKADIIHFHDPELIPFGPSNERAMAGVAATTPSRNLTDICSNDLTTCETIFLSPSGM